MLNTEELDLSRIPQHVAIIMDGNGRWAKLRGQERSYGHQAGAETVHIIAEEASKLGIKYLTLYTFSTENWNRPSNEVAALMALLFDSIEEETFMKKPLTAFRIDVKDTSLSIPCQGLPTGTYAISLFQDENGNGKLDTAVFGIPTEKYGFSNDAQGVMGLPSYDKCSFTFSGDTTLVIHLK